MWPSGYVVQRRAAEAARVADVAGAAAGFTGCSGFSDFADRPVGPATTTLRAVTARTAAVVRCIAIAYIGVQVAIWHDFYLADPWRLAGPVAALAWAAVVVTYLFTRWPQWQFAMADSLFYVVLVLGAGWCVPPAMRGDTANWLFIMMAGQLLVAVWFARLPLSALLALVSGAAYWTGSLLYPEKGPGGSSPASAGAVLLAVAVAVWSGRWAVQRWAARADDALARADADSRARYVELSRNIERREHERLLHDTVLNTLTALARGGGDPRAAAGRCQHDIKLMEYVLSRPAGSGRRDDPPYGGVLAGIEAVAAEVRARGLDVHVTLTGQPASGHGGPGAAPRVPARVVVAMTHAVREALSNVASHSGTNQAWVELSVAGPAGPGRAGAGHGDGGNGRSEARGGVVVAVRDAGRGFTPGHTDPARLGLRRSIIERLADQGGSASVRSAPGRGTEVILRWPESAWADDPAGADDPAWRDRRARAGGPPRRPATGEPGGPGSTAGAGGPPWGAVTGEPGGPGSAAGAGGPPWGAVTGEPGGPGSAAGAGGPPWRSVTGEPGGPGSAAGAGGPPWRPATGEPGGPGSAAGAGGPPWRGVTGEPGGPGSAAGAGGPPWRPATGEPGSPGAESVADNQAPPW
jgi:signal transduction histidine kinase